MFKPLSIAIAGVILTACGSDKNKQEVDYDALLLAPQTENGLVLATETALINQINNGIRLQLTQGYISGEIFRTSSAAGLDAAESLPMPAAPVAADSGDGFSETNVHVQGVDEADYVKYDGKHWFIATEPEYERFSVAASQPKLKIVSTDPSGPDAEVVAEYTFDDQWGTVGELYTVQKNDNTTHVASLRNQWGNVYPILPGVPFDLVDFPVEIGMPEPALVSSFATSEPAVAVDALIGIDPFWIGPQNSSVRVDLVNVETPSEPTADWAIELDGSLIQSRKIGNTLYLVTRFDPWLAGLDFERGRTQIREENEELLANVDIDQLMPKYRIGDVETPLSSDCYIQTEATKHYGLSTLIHITAIDLGAQQVTSSECVSSNVENLSMSTDSLYLTGTVYGNREESTVIHKFSLNDNGPSYEATGKVSGSLGWRSDPVFRMHEHEDQFRIVTSKWEDLGPAHTLSILTQQGNELTTLSTLPNSARPAPIGKPREDIFSVRFEEERAYIVTFERTDPLYNINLSDPADPYIAGELEVPGFATYLHPVGNGLMFTFGQEADENGRARGLKAELINIAGDTPEVLTKLNLGESGSFSPALDDLRALSFQPAGEDSVRVALPVSAYQTTENGSNHWSYSGIQLLTIRGLSQPAGEGFMEDSGVIKVFDSSNGDSNQYVYRGRTVLHDDAVFVNFQNDVWASNWFAPETIAGPINDLPVFCTLDFRMGLSVTVNLDSNDDIGQNACDTNVVIMDGEYSEVLTSGPSENSNQCTFVGAGERAGAYLIEADIPGFIPADAKAIVYKDECHVIPEQVEMTLHPEGTVICTASVEPSISLQLSAGDGNQDICDAAVYVEQDGDIYELDFVGQSAFASLPSPDSAELRVAPPIEFGGSCLYQGPGELAGSMTLHVERDGYFPISTELEVPADQCHVITQNLHLELEPENAEE